MSRLIAVRDVHESTVVRLLERLGKYDIGTKFAYRTQTNIYESDEMTRLFGCEGSSQLWYVGATNENVEQWMYSLLLRADFYKGAGHRLKELFVLEYKHGVWPETGDGSR